MWSRFPPSSGSWGEEAAMSVPGRYAAGVVDTVGPKLAVVVVL